MAEIQERHMAQARSRYQAPSSRKAYAQGLADREAEIAVNLRRRDRWGGGAVADKETATDIEGGLDGEWENRNVAG